MTEPKNALRHAPATSRNRDAILEVLKSVLPPEGVLLEIASGTGEHAAYMTPALPGITWQPSDADPSALASIDGHAKQSGTDRIRPALAITTTDPWPIDHADAVLCCNMIHISPWASAEGLFDGAARILPSQAPLILYGPFRRNGQHTAASNVAFDDMLKAQDPRWGVRCLDTEVMPLAAQAGFTLDEVHEMPANNLTVVFRRRMA